MSIVSRLRHRDTSRSPDGPLSSEPRRSAPPPSDLRILSAGSTLAAVLALLLLLHAVGTWITWEMSCMAGWGRDMEADPNSTLGRFCSAQTRYADDQHFLLWPVPLIAALVLGLQWVRGRSLWWLLDAIVAAVVLAFLYYSPFLFLPSR